MEKRVGNFCNNVYAAYQAGKIDRAEVIRLIEPVVGGMSTTQLHKYTDFLGV